MNVIAHVSDLHFGRIDPIVVEALLHDLIAHKPQLVAVSGDLTQRARREEFRLARDFLARVPFPTLTVPGNHDIPLYDLGRRFLRPLHRFRRYISEDVDPVAHLDGVTVLGLNTARSLTWKEGRISYEQMAHIEAHLGDAPEDAFKIVVTHHPFLPPPDAPGTSLVGRAPAALRVLERSGVDLLLAGHLHRAYGGEVGAHHLEVKRSILVAQASTATSTRLRAEPNAYNVIRVAPPKLDIEVRSWTGDGFHTVETRRYCKIDDRWRLLAAHEGED